MVDIRISLIAPIIVFNKDPCPLSIWELLTAPEMGVPSGSAQESMNNILRLYWAPCFWKTRDVN